MFALQREVLQARVAAIGDQQQRLGPRRSTMMPCGQFSSPAFPVPPKVRMYSPFLLYWLM